MTEKTIKIAGQDVRMRYCAAAENGFEDITGKDITKINYTSRKDRTSLAIASIIAAYAATDEEPPIDTKDILYNATQQELMDMDIAVKDLVAEWYHIPDVVAKSIEKEQEDIDESETGKNS